MRHLRLTRFGKLMERHMAMQQGRADAIALRARMRKRPDYPLRYKPQERIP